MADAYMEYCHEGTNVLARWHGGAYIDLGYKDSDGDFVAWDCINVWDYAKDESTIPFTPAAMAECVDEHIDGEEE